MYIHNMFATKRKHFVTCFKDFFVTAGVFDCLTARGKFYSSVSINFETYYLQTVAW